MAYCYSLHPHNNLHILTGMSLKYSSLTGDTKTCQINCFAGSFVIAVSLTAFATHNKVLLSFQIADENELLGIQILIKVS